MKYLMLFYTTFVLLSVCNAQSVEGVADNEYLGKKNYNPAYFSFGIEYMPYRTLSFSPVPIDLSDSRMFGRGIENGETRLRYFPQEAHLAHGFSGSIRLNILKFYIGSTFFKNFLGKDKGPALVDFGYRIHESKALQWRSGLGFGLNLFNYKLNIYRTPEFLEGYEQLFLADNIVYTDNTFMLKYNYQNKYSFQVHSTVDYFITKYLTLYAKASYVHYNTKLIVNIPDNLELFYADTYQTVNIPEIPKNRLFVHLGISISFRELRKSNKASDTEPYELDTP